MSSTDDHSIDAIRAALAARIEQDQMPTAQKHGLEDETEQPTGPPKEIVDAAARGYEYAKQEAAQVERAKTAKQLIEENAWYSPATTLDALAEEGIPTNDPAVKDWLETLDQADSAAANGFDSEREDLEAVRDAATDELIERNAESAVQILRDNGVLDEDMGDMLQLLDQSGVVDVADDPARVDRAVTEFIRTVNAGVAKVEKAQESADRQTLGRAGIRDALMRLQPSSYRRSGNGRLAAPGTPARLRRGGLDGRQEDP